MSMLLAALLAITGIFDNPPEDLLSLGNTEIILKTFKIDQSEKALIDILGGVKNDKKIDTAKLEKAIKLLRSGTAKERREAKKVLSSSGREALPFIRKYVNDQDPEVSQTAKNIIKDSDVAAKQATSAGLNAGVLKLLAIRRLTELKSNSALDAIKALTKSNDADIAREAKRAVSKLSGTQSDRPKRGVAAVRALAYVPQQSGFAAILDMTEPEKSMSLAAYIKQLGKLPMPGMNAEMISGQFNQALPQVLSMVGNPQIDSIAVAMSDKIGVGNDWAGFIFIGSYNLKKIKKLLSMQFEPREFMGKKYFAQKWGPSILPVDKNTLIITVGSGDHMNPFIQQLSAKKAPEKFAELKNTSQSRFMAMGDLSKEQRETMKVELQAELQRANGRQGPESEVQKALNVALQFTDMAGIMMVYNNKVISISGTYTEGAKADNMALAVTEADVELRKLFETAGGGMLAQLVDTKNPFSTAKSQGKNLTVNFKAGFLNTGLLTLFMAGNVQPARPVKAIEKQPVKREK